MRLPHLSSLIVFYVAASVLPAAADYAGPTTAPVVSREIAPGDSCKSGGTLLQVGRDDGTPAGEAWDGVLQDGEVESAYPVCNEVDTIYTSENFVESKECPHGGLRVSYGADNGDGVLDENEIENTETVCNEAPAAATTPTAPAVSSSDEGGCSTGGSPLQALPFAALLLAWRLRSRRLSVKTTRVLAIAGVALVASAGAAHAATYAVETTSDAATGTCAGDCTLRQAVATAVDGDTILIGVKGTIVLDKDQGSIVIDKSLNLAGRGTDTTVISGNDKVRIFKITAGTVHIEGVKLANGYSKGDDGSAPWGGTNNGAGGAIYVASGATLVLSSAALEANQAVGGTGATAVEGASGGGGGAGATGGNYGGAPGAASWGGGGAGGVFGGTNAGSSGGFGGGGGGSSGSSAGAAAGTGAGGGGNGGANGYGGGGGGAGLGGALFVDGAANLFDVEFLGNAAEGGNGGGGYYGGGGGGGGAGFGSAIFTTAGANLCLVSGVTFGGGTTSGGNGGPGGQFGTGGGGGSGLETSTGLYEQGGNACANVTMLRATPKSLTPVTQDTTVTFEATVSAATTVNAGQVTFQLRSISGTTVGAAQVTDVTNGYATANFTQQTSLAAGTYYLFATYHDAGATFADASSVARINVTSYQTASRFTALAVGSSECPMGGVLVETGKDDGVPSGTAGDGDLQDGEVEASSPMCTGDESLVVTEVIDASKECEYGGVVVSSGVDDGEGAGEPGDGKLDADEIDASKTICTAPPAPVTETTVTPVAEVASSGCGSGGSPYAVLPLAAALFAWRLRRLRSRR